MKLNNKFIKGGLKMLWSELERFGRFRDPWKEFERMSSALSRMAAAPSGYDFPGVNVWTAADKVIVTSELPGMDSADIDISIVDNTLTIKGNRKIDEPKAGEAYHRRERWEGQFAKSVALPFRVDAERIEAKYQKGILSISMTRSEADKPKKINIAAG
jgi:HSP20 family protein